MRTDLHDKIDRFVRDVTSAMGLSLDVTIDERGDQVRVDLAGDGGEVLLRRRAEALDALQHIANTLFRRQLSDDRPLVVDYQGYRKDRDAELRQMALFLMDRAKSSRTPQEIGPLNPYARRIVHLTVAEDSSMSSESIGDAFMKTVVISPRK